MAQKILFLLFFTAATLTCQAQKVSSGDSANIPPASQRVIPEIRPAEQLLLIENKKLEHDIKAAQQLISLQNSQLEQANDWIAYFWSALGVTIGGVAIILALQFYMPAASRMKEIRELNGETQRILRNVQGELYSKVKAAQAEQSENRFDLAISTLKSDMTWKRLGWPILSEFAQVGINERQEKILLDLLEKKIPYLDYSNTNDRPAEMWSVIQVFFEALSLKKRNQNLELFLRKYFGSSPFGSKGAHNYIENRTHEYLAKFFSPDLYPLLFNSMLNPHPDRMFNELHVGHSMRNFLNQLNLKNPNYAVVLLNDNSFITKIKENGIFKKYMQVILSSAMDGEDLDLEKVVATYSHLNGIKKSAFLREIEAYTKGWTTERKELVKIAKEEKLKTNDEDPDASVPPVEGFEV